MTLQDVQLHPELTKPPNHMVDFTLEDADLQELITAISTITGKRFIYGGKVRNIKVNIYAPKNQKISIAEAYQTFLSVLETNGLTVIPHGKFLKIVESAGVATQTTPIYGSGQPVPPDDRYITRLYRLAHVSAEEASGLLGKFKSKDGDISVYAPGNLLILTDTATNIRRMLQLVEEVDVGATGDQLWVEPIHYTTATEITQRLNEIFDIKGGAPPAKPGTAALSADTRITKLIPEDRSNSLIIVATERAYLRVLELIRRLDVPQNGEGEIHVMSLQHAMAEELAATLNTILTGAAAAKQPGQAGVPASAGIFEGVIKVTADKATNSLVVTSSLRDYGALRNVIDRLDMARRQVFIEAVIMDLSVDHQNQFGIGYHGGDKTALAGANGDTLMYGGLNPIGTIGTPDVNSLQGLALGVRGPDIPNTTNLLGTGISIPAFGVALNALATSGDANVLATPHVIATDNVAAEIYVGENIPLQTNVGSGLSSLAGAAGAAGASALGGLGGLGGLAYGGGFSAPRQDVGTKIKVVPHINDSNEVRLELTEEISERGASSGALGVVSVTKRTAQTTVVVQDQQTVVIGGLMRDALTRSEKKIPVLGDIPVLGVLFKTTSTQKRKTNLLLILTPYVVRHPDDLRTVFERKMQERQEFLDRYFVFGDQKQYDPPKDYARTNGLLEEIRQSYLTLEDRKRLENETRPRDFRGHDAQQPLDLPLVPRLGGPSVLGTGTAPAPGVGAAAAVAIPPTTPPPPPAAGGAAAPPPGAAAAPPPGAAAAAPAAGAPPAAAGAPATGAPAGAPAAGAAAGGGTAPSGGMPSTITRPSLPAGLPTMPGPGGGAPARPRSVDEVEDEPAVVDPTDLKGPRGTPRSPSPAFTPPRDSHLGADR